MSVIFDVDIYRSANELIKRHGESAADHAATKADESYEARDVRGYVTWRRIVEAVERLRSMKPPKGASR